MVTDLDHLRALGDKSQKIRSAQFIQSDLADSAQFNHAETVISPKSAQFNMPKTALRMKFPPKGASWASKACGESVRRGAQTGADDVSIDFHNFDDLTREKMVALLERPYDLILRWMQYTTLDKVLRATTCHVSLSKYRRTDDCFEIRTEGDEGDLLGVIPGELYWETLNYSCGKTREAYGLDLDKENPVFSLFVGPDRKAIQSEQVLSAFRDALGRVGSLSV